MNDCLRQVTAFTLQQAADDFPESALQRAAYLLLDTLGIAAAATALDAGRIARDVATQLYGAGDAANTARLMFDGRKVSLAGAAYAATTQIDNLDGHDGYNPTKGHIGVAAVPALVCLSETLPGLSGRDALAATVAGYEIAGRAAIALHATVADYHTSGAWNALGIAAMAARLWQLSGDELRQALGIAEYHGPRSQMMREIANPTMLHDGSGWGAIVGISAAVLARAGFTGAPAITLEADEVKAHWADLGSFWQVEHQYIKPYPICRWAHAAVDATRQLCSDHGIAGEQIEAVRVNSFHEAACLFEGMPDTTSKAQYSLQFAVATMIAHGRIGTEHITGEGLSDPVVAALVERIVVTENGNYSARFPRSRLADVSITLRDGRAFESGETHARGGPEVPLSDDEIVYKFHEFADPCLERERARAIVDAVMHLTAPESRFADVAELLFQPANGHR
ncbi:MAG: MmgE/PrpD family protein [Gammaproteobacteria bacterium]|nr:MmgE/PrpD family protein [Gammaproteobacteria bacterium]